MGKIHSLSLKIVSLLSIFKGCHMIKVDNFSVQRWYLECRINKFYWTCSGLRCVCKATYVLYALPHCLVCLIWLKWNEIQSLLDLSMFWVKSTYLWTVSSVVFCFLSWRLMNILAVIPSKSSRAWIWGISSLGNLVLLRRLFTSEIYLKNRFWFLGLTLMWGRYHASFSATSAMIFGSVTQMSLRRLGVIGAFSHILLSLLYPYDLPQLRTSIGVLYRFRYRFTNSLSI